MTQTKQIHRRRRAQLSCDRCRKIKRQCDRNAPCGRCVRDGQQCLWVRAIETKSTLRREHIRTSPLGTNTSPTNGTRLGLDETTRFASYVTATDHSTAPSYQIPRWSDANSDVWTLIETTSFMKQIIELYTNEIDWIWDLIKDSRLEHLVRAPDHVTQNRLLWNEVKVFAMAIVAITAQLCPVDVDAILLCLDAGSRNFATSAFCSAKSVMEAAYSEAAAYIKRLAESEPSASAMKLKKSIWTAEVFAAAYLLRNYDKHEGAYRRQGEGLAVDIVRLQHAGYARQPCRPCLMSKELMVAESDCDVELWPVNHNALAHNVFWAYFTLDRLSNVVAGSTYLLQAKDANICLNDVFGHTHIQKLNDLTTGQNDLSVQCTTGATVDHPIQSAYSGAKCRFAAVVAHFTDRLTTAHDPTFNWPMDAEQIVKDLEKDLDMFDTLVLPTLDDPSDRFYKAKKLTLALCMELLRTNVTAQIHILFAATLYQPSLSAAPVTAATRQSIGWQMERRKLDSAKLLIARVLPFSQAALQLRSGWPFFATSVYQQVDQILTVLRTKSETELVARYTTVDDLRRSPLLEYVRYAIKGRNFLALLGRSSALPLTASHIQDVCKKMEAFFFSLQIEYDNDAVSDEKRVVDEHGLIQAMKNKFDSLSNSTISQITTAAEMLPTPPDSSTSFDAFSTSDLAWNTIMADMAELERLFLDPDASNSTLLP